MAHTIRTTAVATLGATDETIAPKGAVDDIPGELGAATGTGWIDESVVVDVERAADGSDLVDGVTGAIVEQVAVQAPAQRQNEPSVVVFAVRSRPHGRVLTDPRLRRRRALPRRPRRPRDLPQRPGRARPPGRPRRAGRALRGPRPRPRARSGRRHVRGRWHGGRSIARLARSGAGAVRSGGSNQGRARLEPRGRRRRARS